MNLRDLKDLLVSLKPTADLKVMDLVAETGIDVLPWSIKRNGTPVANPRANPNYCYDWAFGGSDEPIALCVWYQSLDARSEGIVYEGNMRALAARLEEVAFDRRASSETKSRAKSQAKRCDRFDQRVQIAFRRSLPVRVILLQGEMADDLGHDSSKVEFRRLDDVDWWVRVYDDSTGAYKLIRGEAPRPEAKNYPARTSTGNFVDQFSIPDGADRQERTVDAFVRSAEVRRRVLQRAGGVCESCGRCGFVTSSGGIYLETHHVIPLSEKGADTIANVVALCPDDHRRAHYGVDRAELRDQLLARLVGMLADA